VKARMLVVPHLNWKSRSKFNRREVNDMAANPNLNSNPGLGPQGMPAKSYYYHAESNVLHGSLKLPIEQEILEQVPVKLNGEYGGHVFQRIDHYNLEGVISFQSGYTHVSGNPSQEKNHGWVTLATSVLEGLNVLDVITADRMVAQVSTEHPKKQGHVPSVTFLGTRFDNLRVAGYEVQLELDLVICGDKPKGDTSYLDNPTFIKRWESQKLKRNSCRLPSELQSEYDRKFHKTSGISSVGDEPGKAPARNESLKCSLIKKIEPIPGVKIHGNVLEIPGFGFVSLAEVEVGVKPVHDPLSERPESHYFALNMIEMYMGCIGEGRATGPFAMANGHTRP